MILIMSRSQTQKKKKKRKTKFRIDQRTARYFDDFPNMSTRKKREKARDRADKIRKSKQIHIDERMIKDYINNIQSWIR